MGKKKHTSRPKSPASQGRPTGRNEPALRFITVRRKPLNELTADDVPRGIDPEDCATDYPKK